MNIAIIDKAKSNVDYSDYFDFDFDLFHLCNTNKTKLLKKDITLDYEFISEEYDIVILVGAEACRFVGKINSVIKYQGTLVNNKYIPITNPSMLVFKPEGATAFNKAVENVHRIIKNDVKESSAKTILIDDYEEAEKYLEDALNYDIVALDTETSAFSPRDGYILGISIAYKEDEGAYISSNAISERAEELLKAIAKGNTVFHNAKFDFHFFKYHLNLEFSNFDDTMLIHYALDENTAHDLKSLAIKYTELGDYERELDIYKSEYCKKHGIKITNFTYDLIPFDIIGKYAAKDAIATLQLYNKLFPYLRDNKKLYNMYKNLLIRGTVFLTKIEENGVPIDKERLAIAEEKYNKEIEDLKEKFYEFDEVKELEKRQNALFNPNSTQQLTELLYNICKLEPMQKYTKTGKFAMDAEVLEELAYQHDLAKYILQYKKKLKIKSTYIDKIKLGLDTDSRLRTGFNLHTTTSGRLSSSGKLNMQQLPRDDKTPKWLIKANDGHKIVSQDLGTAEMYVVSVLSGDKRLQKIFIDNIDYHGMMAKLKFNLPCDPNEVKELYPEDRQNAKTISFEILYKLNLREEILEKFPTLKKWLTKQIETIKNQGYIYQFFGRKRRLPNVYSVDKEVVAHEIRSGVNSLVQGPSSDINLLAGIEMQEYIEKNNMKSKIFGLVHDSILAEVPDDELDTYIKMLAHFTQKDRGLSIPNCPIKLDVAYGEDYKEAA